MRKSKNDECVRKLICVIENLDGCLSDTVNELEDWKSGLDIEKCDIRYLDILVKHIENICKINCVEMQLIKEYYL